MSTLTVHHCLRMIRHLYMRVCVRNNIQWNWRALQLYMRVCVSNIIVQWSLIGGASDKGQLYNMDNVHIPAM